MRELLLICVLCVCGTWTGYGLMMCRDAWIAHTLYKPARVAVCHK
jgi:hypothetical protein